MYIDIKLNVQTMLLLGVICGMVQVVKRKDQKIATLTKELEELKNVAA